MLTPEQAYALLESPAACYFRFEFFEALGTPLTEHTAEIVEYDPGWGKSEIDHRVSVRLDPPGDVKRAQYAPEWVPVPDNEVIHFRTCSYSDAEGTLPKHPNERWLNYRNREGFKATAHPWPGTVLDELRWRSNWLAKVLGWTEEDAVWTLLTGQAPTLPPLKASVKFSRGKPAIITMEAPAWLSGKVWLKNLQELQRQVLTEGSHELPLRSLAVFHFVEQHTSEQGDRPSLKKLWEKWNRENPTQKYESYRGFSQTYRRTRSKVLQPYRVPESNPSAKVEKRVKETNERLIRALEGHIEKHGNRWSEESQA